MLSIELNLMCEERNGCDGSCVTSIPTDDINEAMKSVLSEAEAEDWAVEVVDGKLIGLCPDCQKYDRSSDPMR